MKQEIVLCDLCGKRVLGEPMPVNLPEEDWKSDLTFKSGGEIHPRCFGALVSKTMETVKSLLKNKNEKTNEPTGIPPVPDVGSPIRIEKKVQSENRNPAKNSQ